MFVDTKDALHNIMSSWYKLQIQAQIIQRSCKKQGCQASMYLFLIEITIYAWNVKCTYVKATSILVKCVTNLVNASMKKTIL